MPRPHAHQYFKGENGAQEPFSGRKAGTHLGKVQSPPPTSEPTGASLAQTQGRIFGGHSHTKYLWLPQKGLHSC